MDRKAFGRLLAALREEMGWTQAQLSELVDVDEAVISQMERGVRKQIEPAIVFRLANAFQLTTLERREFFLASSGMEPQDIFRQSTGVLTPNLFDEQKILDRAISILQQLRIPAFVVDVFSDILSANRIIIDLFRISSATIAEAPKVPGGYSTLRLDFSEAMRSTIPTGYEEFAITSLRSFREVSLRYRAHPYFQHLMKEFRNPKKFPWFERIWRKVSLIDDDNLDTLDLFTYQHIDYGLLKYYATIATWVTPHGELFLVQYLPLDEHTSDVFEQITRRVGSGALRFAPWPEKNML